MSEIAIQIVYYLNGAIYLGMMYYGFTCLFQPAVKKRWIGLAYTIFLFASSQLFFHFENAWLNFSIHTMYSFGFVWFFTGNLSARFILALLLYALGIVADGISFISLSYIYYGASFPAESMLPIGRTLSNILFLPFLLISIITLRRFFTGNIQNRHLKPPVAYMIAVFCLLLGIIIINIILILETVEDIEAAMMPIMISQFIVLVVIFLAIWLYNRILQHLEALEESRLKEKVLERWEAQYKAVVSSQSALSELKHNLRFHLLALLDFIKKQNLEQAEQYILERVGSFDRDISTGNISIDSIVNYYAHRIRETLGIDLDTKLLIPAGLKLNPVHVMMILGNALENAMEACEHVAPSERYIRLSAVLRDGNALISIENPYRIPPVLDKSGKLVTAKTDKRNHGIGLASIKEMLPEEEGHLYWEYADNKFHFRLLFYKVL